MKGQSMKIAIVGLLVIIGLCWGCTTTTPKQVKPKQTSQKPNHRIVAVTNAVIQISCDGKTEKDITFFDRDIAINYKKDSTNAPASVLWGVQATVEKTSFFFLPSSVFALTNMEGKISMDETISILRFAVQLRYHATGMGHVVFALFEPLPTSAKAEQAAGRQLSNPIALRIQM